MKKIRLSMLMVLAASFAFTMSACRFFETDAESHTGEFWDNNKTKTTATSQTNTGRVGGIVDIDDPNNDREGDIDDWNSRIPETGDYAEGFGPRIPNVEFAPAYFHFDQNVLPVSEDVKIQLVAEYLVANPNAGIVIEGNCDSRGTEEYNRALGERRAIAAKMALQSRGIAESRVGTISYGESKPAVEGENESAWKLNRRAEFIPVYLKGAAGVAE